MWYCWYTKLYNRGQEGLSGVIIGMVGMLISVQLYSTAEIRYSKSDIANLA